MNYRRLRTVFLFLFTARWRRLLSPARYLPTLACSNSPCLDFPRRCPSSTRSTAAPTLDPVRRRARGGCPLRLRLHCDPNRRRDARARHAVVTVHRASHSAQHSHQGAALRLPGQQLKIPLHISSSGGGVAASLHAVSETKGFSEARARTDAPASKVPRRHWPV